MKVVVPMAGIGERFLEKGYSDPKPLIKVNGKRIIEYIIDMYDSRDEFVFICNEHHASSTEMMSVLSDLCPQSKIVLMPKHKLGPVHTVRAAFDHISDDEPVIISYCDNPYIWNYTDFKKYVNDQKLDGCILTHTGFHPHTLSKTKMAFLKVNDQDLLEEIQEKKCYTDDPMNEHASTGVYYFHKGSYVKHYFDQMVKKNLSYNGEFYVTLAYNLLVKDRLRVGFYDTDYVTVFGTPEEVENFNAWATILKGSQVKNEEELVKCYSYWKRYYEKSSSSRHR